ncbi:MAG: hypothetical protein EF812_00245 [Methanosarcinales archaeon]|nr:MAG: hypothetical protein EF812_00245 [Methanosarcinales archaeon]
MLVRDVALVTEAIIRKPCSEMDIQIIDMAVNTDHVHLFIKYPLKYSMVVKLLGVGIVSNWLYI